MKTRLNIFNHNQEHYSPGSGRYGEKEKTGGGLEAPMSHRSEAWAIAILWAAFVLVCVIAIWKIDYGSSAVWVSVIIGLISIGIFWMVILIPYKSLMPIWLTPDRVLDNYDIIHIPLHRWPEYKKEGSCYPLINRRTGRELYPCSGFDPKGKTIYFAHDVRYEAINWLADKRTYLYERNENAKLRDENADLRLRMEESIQVGVARILERLNVSRKLFQRRNLYRINYGQDDPYYSDGQPKQSLAGGELESESMHYDKIEEKRRADAEQRQTQSQQTSSTPTDDKDKK